MIMVADDTSSKVQMLGPHPKPFIPILLYRHPILCGKWFGMCLCFGSSVHLFCVQPLISLAIYTLLSPIFFAKPCQVCHAVLRVVSLWIVSNYYNLVMLPTYLVSPNDSSISQNKFDTLVFCLYRYFSQIK